MQTRPDEVLRRQAVHSLATAITGGHGWSRDRANEYDANLADIPVAHIQAACQTLKQTWTERVVPTIAHIRKAAEQHQLAQARRAAAHRQTTDEERRGIPRTEFDLDAPLCPRCGGGLMWLTHDEVIYCHPCNGVIVQDNQTGRVRLTQAERDALRVAAGPPGRHMRYGPHDPGPGDRRGRTA